MAPEIDGDFLVRSDREMIIGQFYEIEVRDSYEYDLIGEY